MNKMLDILPTYAEDRSVIVIIISSPEKKPISDEELADAMFEYARFIDYKSEDLKN
jgi:hypothetical protein